MGVTFAKGAARRISTKAQTGHDGTLPEASTQDASWRDILNAVAEMDLWEGERREHRPIWRDYLKQAETLLQQPRAALPKELVESVLNGDIATVTSKSSLNIKKKIVMFVSSTFTDTKAERNTLMKDVYPYLRALCRILGLDFGSVDMRWGVNEETTLSHGTAAVCVQEVERCLNESAGPAFLAVLGHKYGHQPLPSNIPVDEFNKIRNQLIDLQEDISLLDEYYREDENMVPPHFVLKPRDPDQKDWWTIFDKLQKQFRLAAPKCLSEEEAEKYFISVTENEVNSGLFNNEHREKQGSILRRSLGDVRSLQHRHRHIIDIVNEEIDEESQRKLEFLKGEKIDDSLSSDAILDFKYDIPERQKVMEYVRMSCDSICENLTRSILNIYQENLHVVEDEIFSEILQHAETMHEKCDMFVGRKDLMDVIETYNSNDCKKIFVVHGQSGCGKTALMAMSAKKTKESRPNAVLVVRFLGTTGASGSARAVLQNICLQITRAYSKDANRVPNNYKDLIPYFQECLSYATSAKPLHLFLDSLDQLSNEDFGKNLKWLSLKEDLPSNVHLVVSTLPGPCMKTLCGFLSKRDFAEVEHMSPNDGPLLLQSMLGIQNRTLTLQQNKIVLDAFQLCPLPLYMRLAVDVALRWHSYDDIDGKQLAPDMPGLINTLFLRLESKYGQKLVHHALAYITVAKRGLSVNELEDILSCDNDVLEEVFTFWEPPFIRIPPLLWIRIRNELGSYLVERGADGTNTYGWYHRQFWETAEARYVHCSNDTTESFEIKARRAVADYFEDKWFDGKMFTRKRGSNIGTHLENRKITSQPLVVSGTRSLQRYLNRRKLSELSHQFIKLRDWEMFEKHITSLEYIEAKFEVQQGYECIAEFTEASKLSDNKTIKAAAKFIGAYLSHLIREPQSIYQLASQQVCANTVRKLFEELHKDILPCKIVVDLYENEIEDPCQMTLQGHTSGVRSCCYSPNGDLIASCAEDGSLRIWDSFSGAEVVTVTGLPGPSYPGLADPYHGERPCCFSTDGTNVATGSEDGWLQIWDLSGAEIHKNNSHTATITGIVYLAESNELFSCSKDQTGKFWKAANNELVEVASVNLGMEALGCDISTKTSRIAVSCVGGMATVDLDSKTLVTMQSGYTNLNFGCCFDPNGKEIASGGDNSAITLWDASSGLAKSMLRGHRGWVWCVKYTIDGTKLISCSSDRSMKVWDMTTKTCIVSLGGHLHRISWASVKPVSGDMFVSGSLDYSLKIWDLVAVANGLVPPVGGLHYSLMTVTVNREYVISSQGWSTSCLIMSPNGGQIGSTPNHGGFIADVDTSPDSRIVVTVDTGHSGNYTANAVYNATVKVASIPDGQVLCELPAVGPCAVSCSSDYIVIGTAQCKLVAFKLGTNEQIISWDFCEKGIKITDSGAVITSISTSSNGLVATAADKVIKIWNISDPESGVDMVVELPHKEHMTFCKYSPDNKFLITSGVSDQITVYDVGNAYTFLRTLKGHSSRIKDITFSPSGRYLATVDSSNLGHPSKL